MYPQDNGPAATEADPEPFSCPAFYSLRCCRDDHGRTALHWAAFLGLVPVLGLLLAAGEQMRAEAAAAAAPAPAPVPGSGEDKEEALPPIWMMQVRLAPQQGCAKGLVSLGGAGIF